MPQWLKNPVEGGQGEAPHCVLVSPIRETVKWGNYLNKNRNSFQEILFFI